MTLEEVRSKILDYEEKREKLQLMLIDLNNKLASVSYQASLTDGQYTGDIFSFEIIDRTVVESFSLMKDQTQIFRELESIRRVLWNLNSKKQIMLHFLSLSYPNENKIQVINEYRTFAQNCCVGLVMSISAIEKIFKDGFELLNPFKQL